MPITILRPGTTFTTFEFYNVFLKDVALFYKNGNNNISFSLTDSEDIAYSKYRIDGNSLPLLLNIFEQLSVFEGKSLPFKIKNIKGHDTFLGTDSVISFLKNSNFFEIAMRLGNNYEILFPKAPILQIPNLKEIITYNQKGSYEIDCFSLDLDIELKSKISNKNEEEKRDILIEYYMFKVEDRFSKLYNKIESNNSFLQNSTNILDYKKFYLHILPELITNGVLHSGANTFASLFNDGFKTKISVSDNGVGLQKSLESKTNFGFYIPRKLTSQLEKIGKFNINQNFLITLHLIFETLYFSMIKNRLGLFDLIGNVVLKLDGVFRMHTENTQVVLSKRINVILVKLYNKRKEIIRLHDDSLLEKISKEEFNENMIKLSEDALRLFVEFYTNVISNYSKDVKFSSVRFYPVKFKGVHIEVEIPN